MITEILETSDNGKYQLVLKADPEPSNPRRDYDHQVHVVTQQNSRYLDVDKKTGPLGEIWEHLGAHYLPVRQLELFERAVRMLGGISVLHTPQNGPRSVWYLTASEMGELDVSPKEVIESEIQEYQDWAEGNVFGFIIEKSEDWKKVSNDEMESRWEEVESCWGYIGYEYAVQSAKEEFKLYNK